MNPGPSTYPDGTCWKELYRAAILEGNTRRIPEWVTEAEHAIIARARQLFGTFAECGDEKEALDDAMYALHALETSSRHRSGDN